MNDSPTTVHVGPLSGEGLIELSQARAPGAWIYLHRADLEGVYFEELGFERLIFGFHPRRGERSAARLDGASFRECAFVECQFAHVQCVDTDFRGALITKCDFRYASFSGGTFANAELIECDFYRAAFERGVVFDERTEFKGVSLDKASLGGIIGLRRQTLERDGAPALAQEDEDQYAALLERTSGGVPRDANKRLKKRLNEAELTYRALSGLWSGQGVSADAAWAYVEAKHLERKLAWRQRDYRRWLGLASAAVLCRYGEGPLNVLGWIVALTAGAGFAYWGLGGVDRKGDMDATLGDCLLFSAGRLTASTPDWLSAATVEVEWIGVAQTVLGIALLGLLGFVLGNKLRSS